MVTAFYHRPTKVQEWENNEESSVHLAVDHSGAPS